MAATRWALAGLLVALCALVPRPGSAAENAPAALSPRFTNSLGLVFVEVPGTQVRFATCETRVQDYRPFLQATGRAWSAPVFPQGPDHPIVNVNWDDAKVFCGWLTEHERKAGQLTGKQGYRLPTDEEWSLAVGVGPDLGRTPAQRMRKAAAWPWGAHWPPLAGEGNYGPELKMDDFPNTAPVARFKPNRFGLHDLGGNVWEWCEDWFNEATVSKALRGGSFNDAQPTYLLSAYRFNATMNLAGEDIGFRLVLEGR